MIDKEKAVTPIKSLRTSAQHVQILLQVMEPLIITNSFENFWHFLMFKNIQNSNPPVIIKKKKTVSFNYISEKKKILMLFSSCSFYVPNGFAVLVLVFTLITR